MFTLISKSSQKNVLGNIHAKFFAVASAVFTILFSSFNHPAPVKIEPLVLSLQKLEITPKEFYINQVTDERPEQKAVAWIYPPTNLNLKQKPNLQAVDLKGGGLNAIQNFMWQSLPQNKKLRPVLVHLKECRVIESLLAPGRVEGKVALSLSFDLITNNDPVYLTDYRIDTEYTRSDTQMNVPASVLSSSLAAALKYLNTWMNSQANDNPKLAREVKVTFKEYQEKPEGDTIYYAVNRPLKWADFQEKAPNSKYAATVFPSFGFEEKSEIANGVIRIRLEMKTYVPKSACWAKESNRDDYALNHEQRHFDVVKIVEKRFEQKIRAAKLPVTNCDGIINFEFYESFREMNHLQDQYDDETQHGLNTFQQEQWNKKIDQDLAALGIKAKTAS